jgi:CheY-like chemotaxis protein/signal transduction histidine kinase
MIITSWFTHSVQLFLPSLWQELVTILVTVCVVIIFFWVRIYRIKHQKMELQRLLIEKSELLSYAVDRERRALEKAAATAETKNKLLSLINHEIRTPMNGVMGMVALLEETSLTPEQKEYKETIRNCGTGLLTVINDILLGDVLAHAKMESNTAELEQKDFDLRNSIEEVFDVFASQAAQKDVELVYQVDHRIPDNLVGDDTRLRKVLMNLVDNSIKFTKQGEIFINVSLRGKETDLLDLEFEVCDSGAGIAKDELAYLAHAIKTPGAQRSGVGLFLCNRVVEFMGGEFHIESRTGEGTAIRFNVLTRTSSITQRSHADMIGVEGKKVLIVEDNTTLRGVLEKALLNWKLIPVMADSGKSALAVLSERRDIDLVLAEMQMPGMDGMELSRSIRDLHPSLPIILISAANNEASKQHPGILSSVVTKPIRRSILSQHILSALIHKVNNDMQDQNSVKQKLSIDFSQKFPLKILIGEDNPMNQKLALKVLSKLGYKADAVKNGKEVLEEVSKLNYDLILMDVQMPEMDGLEATRMIRLCLSAQPVIIAMTANAMQGDREECLRAGMDDYISKPVNIEELVIMLEKWALHVNAKL